ELKSHLLAKEAESKRTTSPEDSPRQKQRGEVHAEELDDLEFLRPLLCFTIYSPSGAELESVIDTSGHAKTAQFYYEQLKAAILRVGVDDVVAVFSDNARACVKAGQKLEEDDELRVFFMPCGSHSLDLGLEDIGKLPLVQIKAWLA
ncbi:hypothetical protein QJQ45_021614, partial [Haematococcus lacustris]